MSFSSEVKEELSRHISKSRHCQIAEFAAIFSLCGRIAAGGAGKCDIRIHSENIAVARKAMMLIKEAFSYVPSICIRQNHNHNKSKTYVVSICRQKVSMSILQAVKLVDANGILSGQQTMVSNLVIQQNCCKRSFIRGAFLATGSISDPEKFYHFEIVCATPSKAEQMKEILNCFDLEAKIVERKKHYVVYIKEGDRLVDVLNVMEAHVALMNLENVRIVKEMRNFVNRQVNCETANINKTVSAAVKQVEDIVYLQQNLGLESLSESMEEMARLRLENQEASLKELGMMLNPPVGKSGVNHRLRKLSILADEMREKKGGYKHD